MDKGYFFCQGVKYPFDITIFRQHSNFILDNTANETNVFNLLDNFDFSPDLTEKSIQLFIDFCQSKSIDRKIDNSNVLSINYLSNKYQVGPLIQKTNNYIKKNYKKVIYDFFSLESNSKLFNLTQSFSKKPNKNIKEEEEDIDDKKTKKSQKVKIIYTKKTNKKARSKQGRKYLAQSKYKKASNTENTSSSGDEDEEKHNQKISQLARSQSKMNRYKPNKNRKGNVDNDDDDDDNENNQKQNQDNNHNNSNNNNNDNNNSNNNNNDNDSIEKNQEQNKEEKKPLFIPKIIEDLILEHFTEFLTNDEYFLLLIPLPNTYRILLKYSMKSRNTKSKNAIDEKIIDYLFQYIENYGIESSLLLNIFDFDRQGIEYFNEKLCEHCDSINLNVISKKLFKNMHLIEKQRDEREKDLLRKIDRLREEQKLDLKDEMDMIKETIKKIEDNNDKEIRKLNEIIEIQHKQIQNQSCIIISNYDKINLPEEMNKILECQFMNSTITSLSIPPTFTMIERKAFSGCSQLKFVTIPSSIVKIGEYAFDGCSSLTELIIPPSVTEVEQFAFKNCINLNELTIDLYSTSIEKTSFDGCQSLHQLTLASTTKPTKQIVFSELFHRLGNITKVIISSSTDSIEPNAFNRCKSIKQVCISSQLTQIGSNCFANCSNLEKVELPSSLTKICEGAFKKCSLLAEIEIPSNVTQILSESFSNCSSLTEVKIPQSVTQICSNCFEGCEKLEKIEIPETVTKIDRNAFTNCESLRKIEIPQSVTQICENTFSGCTSLEKVELPTSLTKICSCSFSGCKLREITIPSSVKQVESDAFKGCSSLRSISFPSSIEEIGDNVFSGCSSLREVEIPESAKVIGQGCFSGCENLTKITIPNLKRIEENAFNGCRSLAKINVPESVTDICDNSFAGCLSLEELIIPPSVNKIGQCAFDDCQNIKELTIDLYSTNFEITSFDGCRSLHKLTLTSTTKTIQPKDLSELFDRLGITEVTISPTITKIEDGSFSGCKSLKQVYIPSSVEQIGSFAFDGCENLAQLTIDLNKTRFEPDTFNRCDSLSHLMLISQEESMKNIGFTQLFQSIGNITEVTILSSVTSIDEDVFDGCSSITQINVPPSVKKIGKYDFDDSDIDEVRFNFFIALVTGAIFKGCSSLKQVKFSGYDLISNHFTFCLDKLIDIDDYKIGDRIAVEVYKAYNLKTHKNFALKYIDPSKIESKIDLFTTINMIPNLEGVLQIKGIQFPMFDKSKSDKYAVLTDFMDNGNVSKSIKLYLNSKGKKSNLNPTIRSKIIFGVASTMKKLSERNIVNVDFSFDNIYLDENLEPKIGIFSKHKYWIEHSLVEDVYPNYHYTAPEVYFGYGDEYKSSADVFSFAMFLYRMFSINVIMPNKFSSNSMYLQFIKDDLRPIRPPIIPDNYWELIKKCWITNPDERLTFAEITDILKDDEFALVEFGEKTDLDDLREYRNRIESNQ